MWITGGVAHINALTSNFRAVQFAAAAGGKRRPAPRVGRECHARDRRVERVVASTRRYWVECGISQRVTVLEHQYRASVSLADFDFLHVDGTAFTIAFWLKMNGPTNNGTQGTQAIFSTVNWSDGAANNGMQLWFESGHYLKFRIRKNTAH